MLGRSRRPVVTVPTVVLGRKGLGKRNQEALLQRGYGGQFLQAMWPEALYPVSVGSVSPRVKCDETDLRIKNSQWGKTALSTF